MSSTENKKIKLLSWTEIALLVFCFLGISQGVINLRSSTGFLNDDADTQTQGKISAIVQDVRLKKKSQISWLSTSKNAGLRTGDQVFTGDMSEATLELGKVEVELGEQTLIEVEMQEDQAVLSVTQGKIAANLNGGSLIIRTENGEKHFLSGKGRVRVNDGIVTIESGSVSHADGEGRTIVSTGKMKSDIISSFWAKSDKDELYLEGPEEDKKINFLWTDPSPGKVQLEIWAKSSFEIFNPEGTSMVLRPRELGTLKWRASLLDFPVGETRRQTEWKEIKVNKLPPTLPAPTIITPKVDHEILDQI